MDDVTTPADSDVIAVSIAPQFAGTCIGKAGGDGAAGGAAAGDGSGTLGPATWYMLKSGGARDGGFGAAGRALGVLLAKDVWLLLVWPSSSVRSITAPVGGRGSGRLRETCVQGERRPGVDGSSGVFGAVFDAVRPIGVRLELVGERRISDGVGIVRSGRDECSCVGAVLTWSGRGEAGWSVVCACDSIIGPRPARSGEGCHRLLTRSSLMSYVYE